MSKPCTIETDRLLLLPFAEEHLTERYVSWLNDPEVVRFSEQRHKHHTLESCRAYWLEMQNSAHLFWAIVVKDSALGHIGNMTVYIDSPDQPPSVAILVGEKKAWKQGYGSEAWIAVCHHLLYDLSLRKVCAGTLETNPGMLRLMEKVGMIQDGRRIRHVVWEGEAVDVVHAALFPEDLEEAGDNSGKAIDQKIR